MKKIVLAVMLLCFSFSAVGNAQLCALGDTECLKAVALFIVGSVSGCVMTLGIIACCYGLCAPAAAAGFGVCNPSIIAGGVLAGLGGLGLSVAMNADYKAEQKSI